MMETLKGKPNPNKDAELRARTDLSMARGGGTTVESIILTQDLPKSFPLEADGRAYLAGFGFSADVLENILQEAYHSH